MSNDPDKQNPYQSPGIEGEYENAASFAGQPFPAAEYRIVYEMTAADVHAVHYQQLMNWPGITKLLWFNYLLFPVVFLSIAAMGIVAAEPAAPNVPMFIFGLSGLLWFLYYPWLWRRRLKKRAERQWSMDFGRANSRQIELTIAAGETHERDWKGERIVFWRAVERIDQTPACIFLFSGSSAAVAPRRAFKTDEDFQTFADAARHFRESGETR